VKERRKPGGITRVTVKNLFSKPATIVYPKSGSAQPQVEKHYRGRLLYQPDNCVNCRLCMKDCPTGALTIINDGTREDKKMRAELNLGLCIFCCQCVDSCRRGCLSFSQEVNLVAPDKAGLTVDPGLLDGKKVSLPPKPAAPRRPAAAAKPAAKPAAPAAPGKPAAIDPVVAAKLADAVTPAVSVVPLESVKPAPAAKPRPAGEKRPAAGEPNGNGRNGTGGK